MTQRPCTRCRSRCGFTLAETLIAMLLMAFVGMIVTGGIAMGARVYGRIVERSNAELLLSTTLIEVRSELDRAEEVIRKREGETITLFYRDSTSNWKALEVQKPSAESDTQPPGIYVTEFKGYYATGPDTDQAFPSPQPLVTEQAATKDLYATFESLDYININGSFQITGLRVCKRKADGSAGEVIARIGTTGEAKDSTYGIRSLEEVADHGDISAVTPEPVGEGGTEGGT